MACHGRLETAGDRDWRLLVAAWNLPPLNVREIRTPDIPQPLAQASEPALAALLGLSRPDSDRLSSANAE
ncbi:hypothetical protein GCM10027280_58790 [Micromonospora polyrhachis]